MENEAKPFLKWAGGKRQLLPQIQPYIPQNFQNYFEPFLGAGALLFNMKNIQTAYVNDINIELINCYQVIRNNVEELIELLKSHEKSFLSFKTKEEKEKYYYSIRNIDRDDIEYNKLSEIEKASRIIFLNKTCFNGLYRVNSKGYFNVPIGRQSKTTILDEENLRYVHQFLTQKDIHFSVGNYERIVEKAQKGDFVYFDPPYDLVKDDSFTSYAKDGFGKDEQYRLMEVFKELSDKGCYVMHSNNRTEYIEELYKDFKINIIKAARSINSKGDGRGKVDEVLITNY